MLYGGGFIGIVILLFWIYTLLEVIGTDESQIRNLPKIGWVLIVLIGFGIGALAWWTLGRPVQPGTRTSGVVNPPRPTPRSLGPAPDDDPEWHRRVQEQRLRDWESELRRREEDLRRREQGDEA